MLRYIINGHFFRKKIFLSSAKTKKLRYFLFNSIFRIEYSFSSEKSEPTNIYIYIYIYIYLIMLSVKQGSIKYHFLSLWYDSTWN